VIVESLQDVGISEVCCGTHFTVFLSKEGKVFSCGLDRFNGHGTSRSCCRPLQACIFQDFCKVFLFSHDLGSIVIFCLQIMSLSDKVVVSITAGAEHILCVTSDEEVYGWGSNNEGQLGLGNTQAIRVPEKIAFLSGKGIQQVCLEDCKLQSFLI